MIEIDRQVLGKSPGQGHCDELLRMTIYPYYASPNPGILKNFILGDNPVEDWNPIQGDIKILLVASCYCRNRG